MVGSPWLGGIIMYGGCTGKKKLKRCSFFFFFFLITLHNCLFSSTKCKYPKFRKHTEMFVCLLLLLLFFFFFFFYGILILIQIEKPLANTLPNRNKPRKQRNHNLIKTNIDIFNCSYHQDPDPYDPGGLFPSTLVLWVVVLLVPMGLG